MQGAASVPHHGGIGRILDQHVIEHIGRVGRQALRHDQPCLRQLVQGQFQPFGRKARNGLQHLEGKVPPDHRTDLRHLLPGAQLIEPRRQKRIQRCRHRVARDRRDRRGSAILIRRMRIQDASGQLFQEQRHALGTLNNAGDQIVGELALPGGLPDKHRRLPAVEAVDKLRRHLRMMRPHQSPLRSGRYEQEHRKMLQLVHQSV